MTTNATQPTDVSVLAEALDGPPPPAAPLWRVVAWRRWVREVAVIAAGALAALAAQAWWQDRQDRERERDYLRHLLADTRENERRIRHVLRDDSTSGATVRRVAGFVYGDGPAPPDDSLATWFLEGGVFSSSAFQPLTGTYAALLTTGDLRLIRDEALRGELIAYAARVDAERDGLRVISERALGDASRIVRTFPFMRGMFSGEEGRLRDDVRRFPFARLRGDPDVVAFVFAVQAGNVNRLNHLRGLLTETGRLRTRLESQGRVGPPVANGTAGP